MDLVELTKEIVLSLVKDKDTVNVKEFETDEENTILIEIMVSKDDIGKVIGKNGNNAKALRTIKELKSILIAFNKI